MPKTKPFRYPTPKKAAFDLASVKDFVATCSMRIMTADCVREMVGETTSSLHRALRTEGFSLVSHRECPGFLNAGQLLLWPNNSPLPEQQESVTNSPAYNPLDGRCFQPDSLLSKAEITNKLFEGDCLEVLPFFPSKSIDLILCDLPYGTTQNKWDSVIPLKPLWQQYARILKPNGVVILTSQGVFTAKVILSMESWFKYKIVWEKSKPTNFLNAKKQPLRKHEDICVFYDRQPVFNPEMGKGEPYDKGIRKNQLSGSYGDFLPSHVKSSGERYPTDVVYFKTAESEGPVWHPTQKPVELGRYLIRTYTNPGSLVLDNAFGSGSFLVASAMEGRNYVGIERNQDVHLFKRVQVDYVGIAKKRLEEVALRQGGYA